MPASRWQTSMAELFEWMGQADEELRLLVPPVIPAVAKKDGSPESPPGQPNSPKYPDVLPILPLRGVVVYPQTAVPLTVGQSRSIRLVDDVVAADKLVGLVTSTNPESGIAGPQGPVPGRRDRHGPPAAASAGRHGAAAGSGPGSLPHPGICCRGAVPQGARSNSRRKRSRRASRSMRWRGTPGTSSSRSRR